MAGEAESYKGLAAGSDKLVEILVSEHFGWAEAIARNVARAWNMDWQLDGLDGGAYEALLFCARRYDPAMGVPFRAYARKRIHEAATEEARKSKAWQKSVGADTSAEQEAREISLKLFDVFPELREGILPASEEGEEGLRSTVQQLLTSASILTAFNESGQDNPEKLVDYKRLLESLANLEPVHQSVLYNIYWGGLSMRALAEEWKIDELTVIREHREILQHVCERINTPKTKEIKKLKVRPSLRAKALQMRKKQDKPPFARFVQGMLWLIALLANFEGGWRW